MGFREHAITIRVEPEGIELEGLWHSGLERAAVIAPPHPQYGGSLDNPVVSELAYALYQEKYATIRFNWRGVGASQGRMSGEVAHADADYAAALRHMSLTVDLPLLAAGYSFGAAAALRVGLREPRVRGMLLVAPPVSMVRGLSLEEDGKPIHVIVGGEDAFAPATELSEILAPLRNARLEVIPGADHFFAQSGLAEVGRAARAAAA